MELGVFLWVSSRGWLALESILSWRGGPRAVYARCEAAVIKFGIYELQAVSSRYLGVLSTATAGNPDQLKLK